MTDAEMMEKAKQICDIYYGKENCPSGMTIQIEQALRTVRDAERDRAKGLVEALEVFKDFHDAQLGDTYFLEKHGKRLSQREKLSEIAVEALTTYKKETV